MSINLLEMKEGDVLVLSVAGTLASGVAEAFKDRAKKMFSEQLGFEVKVVVVTNDVELNVLRFEKSAAHIDGQLGDYRLKTGS